MGGVAVDADGATSLPGLYAVGEVACNGRQLLRGAMGPVRDGDSLRNAQRECARMRGWQASLACALLDAAQRRNSSLGVHWRADADSIRERMVGAA